MKRTEDQDKPLQACKVKKASPPISKDFKVKTEAVGRKKSRCESPKLLTRMKPLKTAKIETLLKLAKPEARN